MEWRGNHNLNIVQQLIGFIITKAFNKTTISLNLSVPVHTNITLESTTFPESSDISIPCDVEGYPYPQVRWYKDDQLLQPSGRVVITGNQTSLSRYTDYSITQKLEKDIF